MPKAATPTAARYKVGRTLQFDKELKDVPFESNEYPVRARFASCAKTMTCRLAQLLDGRHDGRQVWLIEDEGLPTQTLCLSKGLLSLHHLLIKTGHLDRTGACVNRAVGTLEVGTLASPEPALEFPRALFELPCVEQPDARSGLCWWSAWCFSILMVKEMRQVLAHKLQGETFRYGGKEHDVAELMRHALEDQQTAEALRHFLFRRFNFGDDPAKPKHLQGQNGCAQLLVLLAYLDVPTTRLFCPNMDVMTNPIIDQKQIELSLRGANEAKPDEPSVLVIRCFRRPWQPVNRYVYENRTYVLVGMLVGSEHCGHQIAGSCVKLGGLCMAVSDSDDILQGVHPRFWRIEPGATLEETHDRWCHAIERLFSVTQVSGDGVCDINPSTTPEAHRSRVGRDVVNSDYVFLHVPDKKSPRVSDKKSRTRRSAGNESAVALTKKLRPRE